MGGRVLGKNTPLDSMARQLRASTGGGLHPRSRFHGNASLRCGKPDWSWGCDPGCACHLLVPTGSYTLYRDHRQNRPIYARKWAQRALLGLVCDPEDFRARILTLQWTFCQNSAHFIKNHQFGSILHHLFTFFNKIRKKCQNP